MALPKTATLVDNNLLLYMYWCDALVLMLLLLGIGIAELIDSELVLYMF